MAKFRKKPVVIEAVAWYGKFTSPGEWPDWFNCAVNDAVIVPGENGAVYIRTLEGNMRCEIADVIIKGVKGELYPCKPDIFEATYEPVI